MQVPTRSPSIDRSNLWNLYRSIALVKLYNVGRYLHSNIRFLNLMEQLGDGSAEVAWILSDLQWLRSDRPSPCCPRWLSCSYLPHVISLVMTWDTEQPHAFPSFTMDGISAAASIIAVIGLAAKIAPICLEYGRNIKNAKTDIVRLQVELRNLDSILEEAKNLCKGASKSSFGVSHQAVQNCLDDCSEDLSRLLDKLEAGEPKK